MTRALSVELQSDIKASIINGMSTIMISEKFGVSRGVLSKYRQKWFPDELRNPGDWPVIVGVKSKSLVHQLLLEGSLLTACDAYKKFLSLGYSLGYKTTLNVLKSMGFHSRIKQRKPMISHTNMEKRYRWAKKYQYWTVGDWKRVVFSDETKVNVWGSDGCKYYWSRPNDPLKPHHLDVKVKHGGGHIMI